MSSSTFSVCAAIPVIKVLRESLVVTNVHRVLGIVNGTTNFILTAMSEGRPYDDALADDGAEADAADGEHVVRVRLDALDQVAATGPGQRPDVEARQGVPELDLGALDGAALAEYAVGNRMEIWNPEVFEDYLMDSEELSNQVQNAVAKK